MLVDFFVSLCYDSSKKGLPLVERRSVLKLVSDRLTFVRRSFVDYLPVLHREIIATISIPN